MAIFRQPTFAHQSRVKNMTGSYNIGNISPLVIWDVNEKTLETFFKKIRLTPSCVVGKWQLNGVNSKLKTMKRRC